MTLQINLPRWAARLREHHRFKVVPGGRGSSKSWTVARHLLLQSSQHPLQGLCVRETQESLADSVHRLLSNQIEEMGLPGWTIQKDRIFHANGSEITFAGIRTDPAKIKSAEGVDWCWVEEAETVSKVSWDILIPTIRGKGVPLGNGQFAGAEIYITFNPREKTDPTYQRFVINPPPSALVMEVNWRDNPWFPESLVVERDHLARTDPDAYQHVWEGKPMSRSDVQVLRGKWRIERFEPTGGWDGPYFGMDFGFAQDPTHAVECWIHGRNIYVRREARGIGIDIDLYPELLRGLAGAASSVLRCDNSRPESISYLQRHGFPAAIAARKWPGSVEDGVAWLRSHDAIVIHPDCPALAEEARLYAHKVDRLSGDIRPEIVDAHNHGWDAVRYACDPMISQDATMSWFDEMRRKREARKQESAQVAE